MGVGAANLNAVGPTSVVLQMVGAQEVEDRMELLHEEYIQGEDSSCPVAGTSHQLCRCPLKANTTYTSTSFTYTISLFDIILISSTVLH